MSREVIEGYLADRSRRGGAPEGGYSGAAGGAACGDLVRISVLAEDGVIVLARFEAEGCAATAAAAAATCELVEGGAVLEAARVGPGEVSEALGGLASTHEHAAELAADALHRGLSGLASSGEMIAAPGEATLVALSGGVDSAVAALLERERGREVVAVTLKLWADRHNDGERSCCSPEAVLGARRLAHSLGLPHLTLDLEDDFRRAVVRPFLDGYAAGETPNPCLLCNGELRLDAMIGLADRVGASSLATGHYARVVDDGEGPLLAAAADAAKDQTYMLAGLAPGSIGRMRFPLAELTKPEVRAIASRAGLEVAGRRESQDLCFLAGEGKREFLRRHGGLGDRPGAILDSQGRRRGEHRGFHHFTVGQRRGLGVASGEPLYVLSTDADANTVTVGSRHQVASRCVKVRDAVLHRDASRIDAVRLRYHAASLPVSVAGTPAAGAHPDLELELGEPADAVVPGQAAVLLAGELIAGHATIT